MKFQKLLLSVLLAIAITACNGSESGGSGSSSGSGSAANTSPSSNSQPVISVNFSDDKVMVVGTESVNQPNCGGSDASENQVQRTRSVSHVIEVGSGFSVNANGQVGFAGTDVELGSTVAANLGYSYGVEESISKSITVKAAAGKDMEHTIQVEEIWATGTAVAKVGSQQTEIPFSFRKDFRLSQLGSRVVKDCKPELSFLEMIAGSYVLDTWTEASRPIELGFKVTEGTLTIDSTGTADWSVLLEQTFVADPGQVRMTARGKIGIDTKRMQGVEGGEFNNTHYLDAKWGQVSSDVDLAIRGWDSGSEPDPFTVSLDTQSSGKQILQMSNSRGTFLWIKQNS
jgi:hypothetical protein